MPWELQKGARGHFPCQALRAASGQLRTADSSLALAGQPGGRDLLCVLLGVCSHMLPTVFCWARVLWGPPSGSRDTRDHGKGCSGACQQVLGHWAWLGTAWVCNNKHRASPASGQCLY